jgi:hypothetical protein
MRNYLKSNKEIIPPIIAIVLIIIAFFVLRSNLKQGPDYEKNLILAGGFGITILSWFVVGYINNENEKKRNKLSINQSTIEAKRDLKVRFLLDAYFRLENMGMRDTSPPGNKVLIYDYIYLKYAESALTAIQLLGDETTVKLAMQFINSHAKEHFSDLLVMLRDELRKELDLTELPKTDDYIPATFRTYRTIDAPNDLTPEQQYQLILNLNEFQRGLIK